MPPNPCANVDFGDSGDIDKEPPDNINEGNEDYGGINDQDLTMAYNKVIGGGEEVSLLNILGEDEDMWCNDLEVLAGTYLDIFSEESSKELKLRPWRNPLSIKSRNLSCFIN